MCPSFIGILDIQSWWEVPSIAHFCSLFRAAFDLLDFDIEELEEALLTDGTEECASSLLTELIVRLLKGCLGNNDITPSNYQMFLRRLFRQKCQETGHSNIFNADIDFQFLPLRRKVQILHALCDFRLAANDVFELLKNLEAESLRVEPLGWDDNASAYWYFYGTRLYREDYVVKSKGKKRKNKDDRKSRRHSNSSEEKTERVWQVVCFTEADWIHLTEKFKDSSSRVEKDLYTSLSENFLPEIPRLFQEKERLRRKRLWESMPRRTSSRVQTKNRLREEEHGRNRQREEEERHSEEVFKNELNYKRQKRECDSERENRAKQRELKRSQSYSSLSEKSRSPSRDPSTSTIQKRSKQQIDNYGESSGASNSYNKPSGRRTNNSLASATGQILISDKKDQSNSNRKKVKTSQILLREDMQTDMYKVLHQLKAHEDAWPFMEAVEEDYAPNYYSVIRRPMDLKLMEERLDRDYYTSFSMFQFDFNLIVNNCRLYNGQNNEYTEMVDNLQAAFNKLTQKYIECISSTDDEINVEYPLQNPPKKRKFGKHKSKEINENQNKENDSSCDENEKDSDNDNEDSYEKEDRKKDDSIKQKQPNVDLLHSNLELFLKKKKKKLKSSKSSKRKHKDKHLSKKYKEKRRHSKHSKKSKRRKESHSSVDSRKNDEINSFVDSAKESSFNQEVTSPDIEFYKDKYDKIKERRRGSFKSIVTVDSESESNKQITKEKKNLLSPDKNKHSKLKETIEKLKAKSEKNVDTSNVFDKYFKPSHSHKKKTDSDETKDSEKSSDTATDKTYEFSDELNQKNKSKNRVTRKSKGKAPQNVNIKNESATAALKQAAKEITELFDESPKLSEYGSNSNSPSQVFDEYHPYSCKMEDDSSLHNDKEKCLHVKRDTRRRHNKDHISKITLRKKEIQRTIERLQPGKTKGNLISSVQSMLKQEDLVQLANPVKAKDTKNISLSKTDGGESPKLSLGTVLDSVGFGLEKQHNFTESLNDSDEKVHVVDTDTMTCDTKSKAEEKDDDTIKTTDDKSKTEELIKQTPIDPSQEKATPNLMAWIKCFGLPKSGSNKKKVDEIDQDDSKSNDNNIDGKNMCVETLKNEHINNEELIPEGGESPIPNYTNNGRVRRMSTGSSISERSSFSQDLDSPRHQPSHPSPLIRSPASPRMDDHQKNLYPALNGTVRVGFYQDTASVKSSPEKSCSPRDAPQSPYASYSQHVYASNSANSSNNNENASKSPLPGFGANYYDSSKSLHLNKSGRSQDDYVAFVSESMYKPASPVAAPFSPSSSLYPQVSQISQQQHSPQPFSQLASSSNLSHTYENKQPDKTASFPVKKRTYTENQRIKDNVDTDTSSKLNLSLVENNPESYNAKDMSNNEINYIHSSVITSTNTNTAPKMQYSHCSSVENEHVIIKNYDALPSFNDKHNKDHIPELRGTISEINSAQHAMLKKSYDFTMRLNNQIHAENLSNSKTPQNSTLDLKCNPYMSKSNEIIENKIDETLNVNYPNKTNDMTIGKIGNVDILNMGYLADNTENKLNSINVSKIDSINSLNRCQRNFDLYNIASNPSYSSMIDMNTNQIVNKNSLNLDSNEVTQRYVLDKINSNFSYQNLVFDATKRANEEMLPENFKKRQDSLNRPHYNDSCNLNSIETYGKNISLQHHNLGEWKINNKSADIPFGNYRHPLEMEKSENMSVKKLLSDNLISPYNLTNTLNDPSNNIQRTQADHQQTNYSDYSRSKNVHINKSGNGTFSHNPALSSGINSFKPPSCHSSITLDPQLRSLSTLPPIIDRLKEDRILGGFTPSSPIPYDKTSLSHLYQKNVHNTLHAGNNSTQMFSPSLSMSQLPISLSSNLHSVSSMETGIPEIEKKTRTRKKKNATPLPSPTSGTSQTFHSYSGLKTPQQSKNDQSVLPLKSGNLVPASAFNFAAATGVGLSPGLYSDGANFLNELRNPSTTSYITGNYMPSSAALHQRSPAEIADKCSKSDHQSVVHSSSNPYRFLTHPQVRPGYPFLGVDPSSTLYPQLLQRHPEELFRHPNSQMMELFSPSFQNPLGARQQYDSMNRGHWI